MESSESHTPSYSNFVDPINPKTVFLMQQTPEAEYPNEMCIAPPAGF
jgi:hypothetical protein